MLVTENKEDLDLFKYEIDESTLGVLALDYHKINDTIGTWKIVYTNDMITTKLLFDKLELIGTDLNLHLEGKDKDLIIKKLNNM